MSGGRCAPVCDVSLSATNTFVASSGEGKTTGIPLTPLLASISGKPMGSLLSIWRLPTNLNEGLQPPTELDDPEKALHAEFKMENSPVPVDRKVSGSNLCASRILNEPQTEFSQLYTDP